MFPKPPSWVNLLSNPEASLDLLRDTGVFPLTCLVTHTGSEDTIQKEMTPWLSRVVLWIQQTWTDKIELDVQVHIADTKPVDMDWN